MTEKMRKEVGQDLHSCGGGAENENLLHPGKFSHQQDQLGYRRNFRVSEENTVMSEKQLKWKESSTNGQCYHHEIPNYMLVNAEVGN